MSDHAHHPTDDCLWSLVVYVGGEPCSIFGRCTGSSEAECQAETAASLIEQLAGDRDDICVHASVRPLMLGLRRVLRGGRWITEPLLGLRGSFDDRSAASGGEPASREGVAA